MDGLKTVPMEVSPKDKVHDVVKNILNTTKEERPGAEFVTGSTIQVTRRLRGGGKCKDKKNQRGRKQAASPKKPEQESVLLVVLVDMKDTGVNLDAGRIKKTSIDFNALDVDAFTKGSKGASKDSGRNGDSEFVSWYYEKRQCGKFGLGVRSREASVFEASKRSLAETRCVDMMNVDLNALENGSMLLLARNHKIQVGIDSCAAVTVFAHFRWFVTKSCKSCVDLSARKVKGKLRGVSFWCVNPRMAKTCEVLVAVSENDMSHDVFFPCYGEGT